MTKHQKSSINNSTYQGCGCLLLLMGIGVIGAIALPTFLASRNKIRTLEVTHYVRSMNRAQTSLFIEKSAFATSVDALGLGIKTETISFKYSIRVSKKAAFNYALAKQNDLKSYVGGVFLVPAKKFNPNAAKEERTTTSILCEADSPGTIKPAEPTYENGKLACSTGTTQMTR
ncbi:type IV pilin-like G/H family protein [Microcoleus sp. MON2_D6]|uniref:type IV pilin-like G/H family protein n=1 Tax=unclassified Microcoleus TaxID=2642155 RepID=UPI002FD702EA